jgi:hypothetical protein
MVVCYSLTEEEATRTLTCLSERVLSIMGRLEFLEGVLER